MADKRTVVAITADTWVEIINGAKTAKIKEKISNVSYYSMVFDNNADVPADVAPSAAATAEKIFESGNTEILNDAALTYVWLRCSPGEVGSVIVT